MWNSDQPSETVSHLGPVEPIEVFYYFDGPIVYTAKLGLSTMLFSKFEESDDADLFFAVPVSAAALNELRNGRLSLLGALGYHEYFIVEMKASGQVTRYWSTEFSQIMSDLLPEPGVGLDPSQTWVADNLAQLDSYFSVRFSGAGLSRETISFRTFKSLMDNVYEAARNLLAPSGLERAKSNVFDFDIREPAFGSLIVTIDRPKAKIDKVNKHLKREDVTEVELEAGFKQSMDGFFSNLNDILSPKHQNISAEDAASQHAFMSKLMELLPDDDSKFSKVEFNSHADGGVRHIEIEAKAAKVLREAHEAASNRKQEIVGPVQIINSSSSTFVVDAASGRPVTCRMSRGDFEELNADSRFKNNAQVKVVGRINTRTYRDEMFVDQLPEILN